MKKYIICLLAALTIAGCSNNKEVGVKTTEETTTKEETVKQTTESTAKKEETTQETTTESTVKAKEGKSLVIDTTVDRELNADELAAYNTDLAVNYNGFLTQDSEYDLYFIDRGDTTYQEIKFTRGNIENGIVTLFFERKGMTGQTQNCEVRFKDTSEGYHFISCVGKDA